MFLEWIGMVGLLLTNATMFVGIYKHFDGRIGRIYERFDQYKKENENKYVPSAICKVMHDNNNSVFESLENRIEKRFDKLDEQIEKLLEK